MRSHESANKRRARGLGISLIAGLALALVSPVQAANITEMEPNDSPSGFNVLTFIPGADTLFGDFDGQSINDDYWEFTATVGNTYTFNGVAVGCSHLVNDVIDIGFEIRNAQGGFVTFRDAAGDCQGESLAWAPQSSGTYYLVLYEATGNPTQGIVDYRVNTFISGPSPTQTPTPQPSVSPTPSASPSPTPIYTETQISIKAKSLTYDETSGRIYASIPSSEGRFGNTIAIIDPSKGTIQGYILAGSEPGKMTVTDGGEFLYTILDGGGAVRPINLATKQRLPQFTLGIEASTFPPFHLFGADITYLPGSPQSAIVSTAGTAFMNYGARVYDNGVPRPDPGPADAIFIEPSDSSDIIYAATQPSSTFDFYRLAVGVNGLTTTGTASLSAPSAATADMEYANGRVYTTTGREVDPAGISVVGSFTGGIIEPDAPNNRLFVISANNLNILNLTTKATLRTISLGSGTRTNLIRWGNNGLAFITIGSTINVWTITDPALLPQAPAPTPAPLTGVPNVPLLPTFQIDQTIEVAITANDLVYDETRHLLYVSVPDSVQGIGGTITQIDPDTGALGASVSVGSEPTALELTSGDEFLYVGLNGESRVRRVDLATFTAGTSFTLGTSIPFDLAADPLTTTTIAVSEDTGTTPLLRIFDDGVARIDSAPLLTASKIKYKSDGSAIYSFGSLALGLAGEFQKFDVEPSGIPNPSAFPIVVGMLAGTDIQLENGIVYSNGGYFANPETPELIGVNMKNDVPISLYYFYGFPTHVASASRGISYFSYRYAEGQSVVGKLLLYNHTRYLNFADFTVPQLNTAPQNMVTCGTDGVAIRTTNKVVIINLQWINASSEWEKYD